MASIPSDPFQTLALPHDADAEAVRRAFRQRARETHPDRGGSAAAFHAVRQAYGALSADLEGQRARWRPPRAARPAALDPAIFPTCPVVMSRARDGTQTVAYEIDRRPAGWRPGPHAPLGGRCVGRAGEAPDEFGVWEVPTGPRTVRYVFGPPPAG